MRRASRPKRRRRKDAKERLKQENERLRRELAERERQLAEQAKRIADLERQLALRYQNSTTTLQTARVPMKYMSKNCLPVAGSTVTALGDALRKRFTVDQFEDEKLRSVRLV